MDEARVAACELPQAMRVFLPIDRERFRRALAELSMPALLDLFPERPRGAVARLSLHPLARAIAAAVRTSPRSTTRNGPID
jgi:hypothetical protein